METQHIIHNFEPIYNEHSKILMLGTMPSPKSREVGFYYGHPRNRFWKVVSDVCGEAYPETREDKILDYWKKHPETPLYGYPAGTWGPKEADVLINRSHSEWRGYRWRC